MVFRQLIESYKTTLNSYIDDVFYTGIGFIIGIVQNDYQVQELRENNAVPPTYNFYKDSNITEIVQTNDVLRRLEARVLIELEQWPDHAVLIDVSYKIRVSVSQW